MLVQVRSTVSVCGSIVSSFVDPLTAGRLDLSGARLVLTGDDTLLDKSNRYVLATATDAVIGQPPPVDGAPKRWQVKVIGSSLLLCPPARALSVFIK